MTRRRGILTSVLLVVALSLSACAGFPTAGVVNHGLDPAAGGDAPEFVNRPDSPQPGATPEQIVIGFLRAATGPGPGRQWSVAREFLAPDAEWDPRAGVTIDSAGLRATPAAGDDGHHVEVTIEPVATVDATGLYEPSDAGQTKLPFELAEVEGEWRITQAPDGIVLDSRDFTSVFGQYSLMYFDPTWTYLVPDERWFVRSSGVASQIAEKLIEGGPSPWLSAAVATAFPEGTRAPAAVPAPQRVAQVELSAEALVADATDVARMQAQLEQSLATAGITSVEMTVGASPLRTDAAAVRSTRIATLPLVQTEAGFGFLAGEELTLIPGLSEAMQGVDALAVEVGQDQDAAAVRFLDGSVGRVAAGADPQRLDERADLADPTIDPAGFIWSAPHTMPDAIAVFAPDGTRTEIAGVWPGMTQLAALAVSRDGSRVAVLVSGGGHSSVWIAGIVRDGEGAPERLADDPLLLGWADETGVGIAWIDDSTLGILTRTGDETRVVEQPVGGPQTTTIGPATASAIAGANATSPVRLRTDSGDLLVKRGANWQQTASGILVLATQQGLPE